MKASKYRATNNEANFGRPITTQVVGGTHITFELVPKRGTTFFATRWPKGLPGHEDPPDVLRFPHGLIQFGETVEHCAQRLVREQLGMKVKSVKVIEIESYVDDQNHWHIEPGCVVEVSGKARVPREASEIVSFGVDHIPDLTFWTKDELRDVIEEFCPDVDGTRSR